MDVYCRNNKIDKKKTDRRESLPATGMALYLREGPIGVASHVRLGNHAGLTRELHKPCTWEGRNA